MRLAFTVPTAAILISILGITLPRLDPLSAIVTAMILAALAGAVTLSAGRWAGSRVSDARRTMRHKHRARTLRRKRIASAPSCDHAAVRRRRAARMAVARVKSRLRREPEGCRWEVHWRVSSARVRAGARVGPVYAATVIARWCERRHIGAGIHDVTTQFVWRSVAWAVRLNPERVSILAQGGDCERAQSLARSRFGYREPPARVISGRRSPVETASRRLLVIGVQPDKKTADTRESFRVVRIPRERPPLAA